MKAALYPAFKTNKQTKQNKSRKKGVLLLLPSPNASPHRVTPTGFPHLWFATYTPDW